MEDGSINGPRSGPSLQRILAGSAVLVVLAAGLLGVLGRDVASVSSPSPSSTPDRTPGSSPIGLSSVGPTARPVPSQRALGVDERALAAAYLEFAGGFNVSSTDIQISDPLAEFDLVGTRLIDLLDRTSEQIAALPQAGSTADAVRELGAEMTATSALLRAIDPHGPRGLAATEYRQALDYWIDNVKPVTDAIRVTLGLATTPVGDLRL
jgi:hypothetical protein